MEWYELDWKIQDGTTLSHSSDGFTRDKNLRDIFTLFKKKVTEIEMGFNVIQCNVPRIESELATLRLENEMMKQLLAKIIQKDYPEMVIERPEFISANLEKQVDNNQYIKLS